MIKLFLLIIAVLMVIVNASAQKMNLKPGTTFSYDVRVKEKGTFKNDNRKTFEFKVLSKDTSGDYTIQCRLCSFRTIEPLYRDAVGTFDSDSIKNIKFNSTSPLINLAILNKPFELILDEKGGVKEVRGIETLINEAAQTWQLNDNLKTQLLTNIKNMGITDLQSLFFKFREKPIQYGSEWLSGDSLTRYQVTAIKAARLVIKQSAQPTSKSLTKNIKSGSIIINESNGLLEEENTVAQTIRNGENNESYESNVERLQKLRYQETQGSVIDTAWLTMAIKSTTWMSDELNTKSEFDSVKAVKFFKEYDSKYAIDRHYLVTKLHLIQRFNGEDSHKWYSALLDKTPNHYLVGESSHQHNKVQNTVHQNSDSSYALVKMMIKENNAKGWIQQSFAQHLKDNNEKQERIKSYQLLDKLHADKTPEVQNLINPIYLWVKAKEPNQDKKLLTRTANHYLAMKDEMIKKGNGGRYAMLTYSLLQQAGEQKQADALLNYTINRLDKYAKDTLNKERYADQNLLAYAYYLKYLEGKKADSAAAFPFLEKAAYYSPKTENEKAYSSFYDRALLDSKESYRNEYLDVLTRTGDKKNALAVVVEQINSNPGELGNMQKFYDTKFSEKPFKQFFSEDVISAWQEAPAFKLKSIDDKELSLSDFKGKWLILDFWGTWCSPCKAEMPEINSFYKEVKAGKYPGVEFLSIACHDTKDKVTTYFANNNYNLPGVISDNQIEKDYKVPHYPTKVIISPQGKMLMVDRVDWKELIRQFSGLYAAN